MPDSLHSHQYSPLHHLEQKFQYLDELPESLYDTIVTHPHGELKQRIEGILQWRKALLQGQLPDAQSLLWPEPDISEMVLKRLQVLDIVQYCNNQETLTDAILQDVCEAIDSAEQWQKIDPGFDDKLARQHKRRDNESSFGDNHSTEQAQDPDSVESEANDSEIKNPILQEATPEAESQEPIPQETVPQEAAPQELETIEAETQKYQPVQATVSENQGSLSEPVQQNLLTEADSFETRSDPEQNSEAINSPFVLDNDSILEQSWLELSRQWHELEPLFSELSELLGQGWDLTQGLLASQQWRDIIRYRKLVQQLPWLEQVVAALGRLQESHSEQQQALTEQIFEPVKRLIEQEVEIKTVHAVSEMSGIRRSDDISRLLPSELVQLGHPQLNLLWHAKRAEHTLLTYQVEGVLSEHEPLEIEEFETSEVTEAEPETGLGPILVCLDGSASMQGEPENIAKALVLEALRIAWQENRACYVYLFSGPDQILQHELDLTQGGLSQLLTFLTQTFHGGTDIIQPLLTALQKTQQEEWKRADVLLVTDGRFPITDEHKRIIHQVRSQDVRLHGIIIGQWQGKAMQEICSHFHRI